uniref:Uncharacterized protein n=1 Tax=Anopheles albimanus TaxID=7167 RepID=A0A182FIL4_ANOAL
MVQIKKVVQCGPAVGRFAALQQQRNPLAGPPSLSDCLERAEPVQPSRLAVKGGTWHYFQLSCQPAKVTGAAPLPLALSLFPVGIRNSGGERVKSGACSSA